jgi:phytoene dehydrogenase-like protein
VSRAGGSTDVVIVGAGHNGLVAAAMLARAGRSVLMLERRDQLGGAAVSGAPFPGVGVRVSRYAYLVSLFPAALARELGLGLELRRRRVASYTPCGDSGLLVDRDDRVTRESITRATGDPGAFDAWVSFHGAIAAVAPRLFSTMTEPLRSREEIRRAVDDEQVWRTLFEEPLASTLERTFASDLMRGVVLTDGTIGTFAPADDPLLRQNRCFLYHVIGNGTGRWDVPVGGMGALSDAVAAVARSAGAQRSPAPTEPATRQRTCSPTSPLPC